jgi:hypothetical protein
MAFWGRVWRSDASANLASCYNITSPEQAAGAVPGILTDIPVHVSAVSDAVGYWLDQLRRRLAAHITATNSSLAAYAITIKRGSRTDTMTWTLANNQGTYPLIVTYATPSDSGSANFYNMGQALDWIVEKLA